ILERKTPPRLGEQAHPVEAETKIRIWNLVTARPPAVAVFAPQGQGLINSVRYSPDSQLLVVLGSEDDRSVAKVVDVQTGRLLSRMGGLPAKANGDGIIAASFTPDSQTLALAYWSGQVELWRVQSGHR